LAYTIFPGTDFDAFVDKSSQSRISVVRNDALASAVLDESGLKAMAVFWANGGGSVNFAPGSPATFTISSNGTAAIMFDLKSGNLTVSDPTQTLSALSVTLDAGSGNPSGSLRKTVNFTLPSGGLAGSSVSQTV